LTGKQNRGMLLFIVGLVIVASIIIAKVRTYYGLDIQGGLRVVLSADTAEYEKREKKKWNASVLEKVRPVLENRVNATGVSEPTLVTQPPDRIIVELPGIKDPEKAINRIKATVSMTFYLLPQLGSESGSPPAIWREGTDPKTGKRTLFDVNTSQPVSQEVLEAQVFSRDPLATGRDMLPNSEPQLDPVSSKPVITFELQGDGARRFEDATRAYQGQHLAIFLDRELLTRINSVIPGKGIIEGDFTLESAKELSDQLNAGALPVSLKVEETRKLEATLGREAVTQTTRAGAIGLALVLAFMLWKYRLPGLLANFALILYTVFSIAAFKLLEMTLTLPGIAGFILSIGMAVDANILIFERLKEELAAGKTLKNAIDAGFKRAFTAIFDSNICTLLTCYVLYTFGTGPIRGFAVTLALGVAISMFTAITCTRTFLFALVGTRGGQSASLFGLTNKPVRHWHVMRRKMMWLAISVLIIVPGVLAWASGGLKRSIDFTGGTELQIPFAQRHSADKVKQAVASLGKEYEGSRVVISEDRTYIVTRQLNDAQRATLINKLKTDVGPFRTGASEAYANVSGTISDELTRQAFYAVIVASTLIVIYLTVRFAVGGWRDGLKYGLCAVAALIHDVFVVLGAFAVLGYLVNWQIDTLFVTAMLTVIGFSVHDTIIVFDRIRENLHHRQRGETFSDLADRSIDQTIARSIYTSLTVVITLSALFVFGGPSVREFTGALLIGIISGTYSSIFNASVLLVLWKQRDLGENTPVPVGGVKRTVPVAPSTVNRDAADRPLVTPPATLGQRPAAGTAGTEGSGDPGTPRTPRKQPVRRRRM
jgi:SecD/SecF fusion protein